MQGPVWRWHFPVGLVFSGWRDILSVKVILNEVFKTPAWAKYQNWIKTFSRWSHKTSRISSLKTSLDRSLNLFKANILLYLKQPSLLITTKNLFNSVWFLPSIVFANPLDQSLNRNIFLVAKVSFNKAVYKFTINNFASLQRTSLQLNSSLCGVMMA